MLNQQWINDNNKIQMKMLGTEKINLVSLEKDYETRKKNLIIFLGN